MQKINLSDFSKIHFVGIGGSSMSGLACFMLNKGKAVTGSDSSVSEITKILTSSGATINTPHNGSVITTHNPDLVVYTVAVRADNPELLEASKLGIPIIDRAEFLGMLMQDYSFGIAVAGTHGKTTTTSMISSILVDNHLDPSIHIGGTLPLIGGNTRIGNSSYFVTEACEYHDSFLKLKPHIAVILNVEHDHVDYFKTFGDFKKSFQRFVNLVPETGCAVVCSDDPNVMEICGSAKCRIITYGIGTSNSEEADDKDTLGIDDKVTIVTEDKDADWSAKKIEFGANGCPTYDLYHKGKEICEVTLGTVGVHNVRNSLASIATAFELGIDPLDCIESLLNFTGAKRRFEFKGMLSNGIKVIDDYAHHPTEIITTLVAARSAAGTGRVFVAFQPHTYTRTRELLGLFATAFGEADKVLLADIYASREKDPGDINSSMLENLINKESGNCVYMKSFEEIAKYIRQEVVSGDMVITMGAGDIYKVGDLLLKDCKKH